MKKKIKKFLEALETHKVAFILCCIGPKLPDDFEGSIFGYGVSIFYKNGTRHIRIQPRKGVKFIDA